MIEDTPALASVLLQPEGLSPALAAAAAAAGAAGAALVAASLRMRDDFGAAFAALLRAQPAPTRRGAEPRPAATRSARFRLAAGPTLLADSPAASLLLVDLAAAFMESDAAGDAAVPPPEFDGQIPAESFSAWFPGDAVHLAAALGRLERFGEPFSLLIQGADGQCWSAHGAPDGGCAWVALAPADPALLALRAAAEEAADVRDRLTEALEAIDIAPLLVWRRDAEGRLTWANAPYRAFCGLEPEEPLRELDRGAVARPQPAGGRAVAAGDRPGAGRQALYHGRTGQRRWFEISVARTPEGGEIGFAADAGAAVMAESALRRFVETLTETFAHLRIGLAIFDDNRRLGLFNPAFAEMMRLDPAWLAGRPRLEEVLVRLRESRMMPDRADFGAWRAELIALFNQPDAADYAELWHLPGEVAIRVLARPHPQGSLAFLFEDVSETAQLERRFAAETENRRAVIDRLEEAVAAFDPHGGARFANPAFARIWGFLPGSSGAPHGLGALIRRCRPMTAPPPPGPNGAPGKDIWDRLSAFAEDTVRRTAWSERVELTDGRVLRARIATLPDGAILTAFSDITAAERAAAALTERNAALEAAAEMRGALFEQTTRRLRGPLNAVAGHAEQLREALAGDPRALRHAEEILERAHALQDALEGMCDLANAQEGAIALHRGDVDLAAIFAAVEQRVAPSAEERGVTLSLEVDGGTGPMSVDGARLRQILVNVLTDAVQRAPRGRVVRAGARPGPTEKGGGRTVQFWAIEPAGSESARRGLAHALARRLAELHGGSLAVRQGPGGAAGPTEVICTLPAPAPEEETAPNAAAPAARAARPPAGPAS